MSEELQSLLERIRRDGIEKADAEAVQLISAARDKAAAIASEAEARAKAVLQKADQDSIAFAERGKTAVEQAARNVILAVGEAVKSMMNGIVNREVSGALTSETLKQMLVAVVEAYYARDSADSRIEALLNPEKQKEIADYLMSKFAEAVRKGLEVKADNSIISGFRVSLVNQKIQHDFSGDAITEALCQILRPQLAEIVRKAAGTIHEKPKDRDQPSSRKFRPRITRMAEPKPSKGEESKAYGDQKSPPPKSYPSPAGEVKSQ